MPSSTETRIAQHGMKSLRGGALSSARKKVVDALFEQRKEVRLTKDELTALFDGGWLEVYTNGSDTHVGYMGLRCVPDRGED